MAAHNKWQVFLGNSSDLSTQADITYEARGKQLVMGKNKPGSFNFQLPFITNYKSYLNPVFNCVILRKNNQTVWSGPIWSREEDFVQAKFSLSAVGWFQMLRKRFIIDADVTYSEVNEGQIAFNLLDIANTQRPTWITPGANTSTQNRTKKYTRWSNIGQEIENLTNIESSFDFDIHPETRQMHIYEWDNFADNTQAIFGLNWGPRNVANVTRSINADDMKNQYYTVGKYGIAEANDADSINYYNLHQEVLNVNDVADINILGAISNAELAVNKTPRVTINFLPMAEGEMSENVPQLFRDFNIGDQVYLTAKRHDVEIVNQAVRVFGISLDINESGLEHISQLETTYQAS